MSSPKLQFESVSKSFPSVNGSGAQVILRDVTFALEAGKLSVILGPSGTGKTTCLRMMNLLDSPNEGRVLLDGTDIRQLNVLELRRRVALVFQLPIFFGGSVLDNISFGLKLRNISQTKCNEIAREKLALVGLDVQFLAREAEGLSPGEQQRVSIARALAGDPEVLLLDEPTASLDPTAGRRILELAVELKDRLGLTVILITHQTEQARAVGDYALLLHEGAIVESGPLPAMLESPNTEQLRRFLQGRLSGERVVSP